MKRAAPTLAAGLLVACGLLGLAAAFGLAGTAGAQGTTSTTSTTSTESTPSTTTTTTTTTTPPPTVPEPPARSPAPIPFGVTVGGVKVGGLMPAQAAERVRSSFVRPLVFLVDRDTRVSLQPSKLGAEAQVAKAIRRARVQGVELAVHDAVKGHRASPGAHHGGEDEAEDAPARPAPIVARRHRHGRQRERKRKKRVGEADE